ARDALAQIACPTLVLAGEHDGNAPRDMMARMASKIPNAQFETLDDAGHLSYMEQPDRFNQVLATFLHARNG
ncbi:MAG: alpha/beta fold hydrolase, partial [Pseudomonadota bacterium]